MNKKRTDAAGESRRGSASKPNVAKNELPLDQASGGASTPKEFRTSASGKWMQPLQGWLSGAVLPRVVRSSQPWAKGCNPFGIVVMGNALVKTAILALFILAGPLVYSQNQTIEIEKPSGPGM